MVLKKKEKKTKKHGSLWREATWGSTRTQRNSMQHSKTNQWTTRGRSSLHAEEPSRTIVQQRSSSRLHVFRKKNILNLLYRVSFDKAKKGLEECGGEKEEKEERGRGMRRRMVIRRGRSTRNEEE